MAQPNFENLTLHLQGASSELSKVPNLPSVSNNQAILDQFDAVIRRLDELQRRADETQRRVDETQRRVDEIQRQQGGMQTRLVNIENSVSGLDNNLSLQIRATYKFPHFKYQKSRLISL